MLGRTIGNYEIVSQFGEGGMGELFLGRHRTLAREVIIKTIRTEDFNAREIEHLRQRLEREAFVQSQLDHVNIVRVYDFIITDETTCMVMEYVPGRDLRRMIARETGAILPPRAIKLFKQVLRAVDYAHHFIYLDKTGAKHQGIIHRDLKPANILVTPNDIAKVTDFGIVKLRGVKGGTQMGFNPGTPEYMSPEQAKGRELDHRSDLYSLGIVFYEMLTGNVPFAQTGDGDSDFEIKRGHIEGTPPPLRQFKADLSPELEKIVLKALEKNADDRYQTARDFYLVLEEYERSGHADFSLATGVAVPRGTVGGEVRGTGVAVSDDTTVGFGEHYATRLNHPQTLMGAQSGHLPSLSVDQHDRYSPRPPLPKADTKEPATTPKLIAAVTLSALILAASWWVLRNNARWFSNGGATSTPTPTAPNATIPPGMVYLKGGKFTMGRNEGAFLYEEEKPAHEVEVKDFYLDKTEVTNADYAKFVQYAPHHPPKHWQENQFPDGTTYEPVYNVTWSDAQAYCKWKGDRRLPTEEEWEFAARGTQGFLYPYGDKWQSSYSSASLSATKIGKLSPVGNYPLGNTPTGISDLAGNVAEWTASTYQPYPGGKTKPDLSQYVVRGGAYLTVPEQQTTTGRTKYPPQTAEDFIGFRCAKSK